MINILQSDLPEFMDRGLQVGWSVSWSYLSSTNTPVLQYSNTPILLLPDAFNAESQKDIITDTAHHEIHPKVAAFDGK